VEGNPALAYADLFADTSCDIPLKEGHISILGTQADGLRQNEPMAIVQRPNEPMATARVKNPSIHGKYLIKNRAKDTYWNVAGCNPMTMVYFYPLTMEIAKAISYVQVNNHSPIIQFFRG
jgi:hypothetical protein